MTENEMELYNNVMERMKRKGIENPVDIIISLESEKMKLKRKVERLQSVLDRKIQLGETTFIPEAKLEETGVSEDETIFCIKSHLKIMGVSVTFRE